MAIIRLILLVAVLGGITLLLVQNWSPVLPLVFLGMRTQPLPLAIWILFSTVAGAFTTVFVTSLFGLSNYFGQQKRQTPPMASTEAPRRNRSRSEEPPSRPQNPPPSGNQTEYENSDTSDGWERGSRLYDDWEFDNEPEETSTSDSRKTQFQDSDTYVRSSEPKDKPKTDSSYSYSYREPKNSGVGKTESVYDADYRVIVPPYQPPSAEKAEEDDWGFLDEDDIEDEGKGSRH
ncbi:hypothetical protein NUACC21_03290 [Scytonema sp. NUACC21]